MGDVLVVQSAPVSQFRSLPTENDDVTQSTAEVILGAGHMGVFVSVHTHRHS